MAASARVVQFIKGAWDTGERERARSASAIMVRWHTMGEGFTWETQDKTRDIAAAAKRLGEGARR